LEDELNYSTFDRTRPFIFQNWVFSLFPASRIHRIDGMGLRTFL